MSKHFNPEILKSLNPKFLLIPVIVSTVTLSAFSLPRQLREGSAAPVARYEIKHSYPHDPKAFTQGLEYVGGFLYEGTGLNGR